MLKACRLCQSSSLQEVFSLGDLSLSGYFPSSPSESVQSGNLDVLLCSDCGLGQLRDHPDLSDMYGSNYGYRSGLNESMATHLKSTARLLQNFQLQRLGKLGSVLDIGSNDGTLLSNFTSAEERIGIDPTIEKFRNFYPNGVLTNAGFFSSESYWLLTERPADIVCSIAMFYDLEDPVDFAQQVHEILGPEGVWHLELSYTPWVLKEAAYDTVCHEHLLYLNFTNLYSILKQVGFKPVRVVRNAVNGGSIAITAVRSESKVAADDATVRLFLKEELEQGVNTPEAWLRFSDTVKKRQTNLRGFLGDLKSSGKRVSALGASTKGNVLLESSGIDNTLVEVVGEINPDKFGKFLPGTLIPIVPEAEVIDRHPDFLLVLPWHFKSSMVRNHADYLEKGGRFIFPLPEIEVFGA